LQQPLQRGQIEDVLQAFAVGLEDDRERAVAARNLQQALRLETLLPQRRALVGAAARDQQCARGVLAEARAEECALPHFLNDELFDLFRRDHDRLRRRRRVGVRQVKRNAVVRPDRLDFQPERLAEPCCERKRPRCVHARAERRQDAEPPVADLVAETLDHDGPVRRHGAGRGGLLVQERQQVVRGSFVQAMLVRQPLHGDFVALSH
jgi:hypothetical protein